MKQPCPEYSVSEQDELATDLSTVEAGGRLYCEAGWEGHPGKQHVGNRTEAEYKRLKAQAARAKREREKREREEAESETA